MKGFAIVKAIVNSKIAEDALAFALCRSRPVQAFTSQANERIKEINHVF